MTMRMNFVLLLALSAGMLTTSAAAQQNERFDSRDNARVEYAISNPGQSGRIQLVDSDDHRRCDGDHDRDDRGCWDRNRDGNWYYRGNGYRANGYYSNGYYSQNNGWYDHKGNFYPNGANGYYDKHGKWHYSHGQRDRDDR